PQQVAVDATGRFWVCDYNADAIFAYPAGAFNNEAPLVIIKGSNTQLNGCSGLAISSNGTIYASTPNQSAILEFKAGSQANAAPFATYSGSFTTLSHPMGLALYSNGTFAVANSSADSTLVFGTIAGNVYPQRSILGTNTHTIANYSVALDPTTQNLVVANEGNSSVQTFSPAAKGNATPTLSLSGSLTKIVNPFAVAVDNAGYVYVGTCPLNQQNPQASILVFAPGEKGNVAPVQRITGSNVNLACVTSLFVR
ncbi:MAG: hypothetical protein JO199_14210, partial [Candidatus Eremiobacteraeota bacterium]|nr:hypothetical protein [Candidatus Eremiobacteraeota bacterium]